MSSSDSSPGLDNFVQQILQHHEVWGLQGDDGWAVCPSVEFEDTEVFPFFSSEAAARLLCTGEWQSYTPASISLEEFLEDWLPGMHEDNAMAGLDWSAELDGDEFEPATIAFALNGN
ncbi:MAG: DUF2750 domain-containing protein [Pseudomonadales bacterium]|nr:DUF2750 domain-containing protein [Pseudomonadales bacterium]